MTSGGLLGVWGKWVKHAKYIYNIQDFNPEQVLMLLNGRYRNVFLEDYSELEMEIAELDTLIEDLSAYMQSTGRKYADHAATLRSWSARKKRQQKSGTGIPDYTYNEEESL